MPGPAFCGVGLLRLARQLSVWPAASFLPSDLVAWMWKLSDELLCLWAVSGSRKLLALTQLSCLRQWARLYLLSPFLQLS